MRIKDRLEKMLIDKGFQVELLWGVRGQWRKTIMDVMRWEAHCRRPDGMFVHVGSWHTMTECVHNDFDLKPYGSPREMMATAHDKRRPKANKG